ncbi:MAG TPA: VTT domain-containing protein [Terriglobia bacterium]|nr:VTT domain-containing protein [Terriglobia bacterium]
MHAIVQFLVKHGYSFLFVVTFAHQIGLPLPGPLFLLAAGALVAARKLGLVPALGLAVSACVIADWAWYEAGRRWGDRVVHFIHRLAPDPDAAERRSQENFARHGPQLLMVAKFVPGLDAVAPPLAGASGTSRLRFLASDAVGAGLYSGAYAGLGYVLSHDLDRAAAYAARVGTLMAVLAFVGFSIYAAPKLVRLCRFIREFRLARITPEELKQKLDAGEQVFIVDLQGARHRQGIPGAVRIDPRRLEQYRAYDSAVRIDPRRLELYRAYDRKAPAPLPRDREVVLYCDTPREFTSARVALAMRRQGFRRVRPLAGGLRAWQERGFPVTQDLSLWVPELVQKRGETQNLRFPSADQQQL